MQQIKIESQFLDEKIVDKIREDVEKMLKDYCPVHGIVYYIYEKYGCDSSIHYEGEDTCISIF